MFELGAIEKNMSLSSFFLKIDAGARLFFYYLLFLYAISLCGCVLNVFFLFENLILTLDITLKCLKRLSCVCVCYVLWGGGGGG